MSIDKLKEIVSIQCANGNWNYDAYMHGMANGLICALAVLEGTEPLYLSAPKEWLCNKSGPESTETVAAVKV